MLSEVLCKQSLFSIYPLKFFADFLSDQVFIFYISSGNFFRNENTFSLFFICL